MAKATTPAVGSLDAALHAEAARARTPDAPEEGIKHGALLNVETGLLDPNPHQPRKWIDPRKIEELATSFEEIGQLQPIVIAPYRGRFIIIAGETRWRGMLLAYSRASESDKGKFATIAAVVRVGGGETGMAVDAYTENEKRTDLNVMDAAAALANIRELEQLKKATDVAKLVGDDARKVRRLLALYDNAPPVIHAALRGQDLARFLVKEDEGEKVKDDPRAARDSSRMLGRDVAEELAKLWAHLTKKDASTATMNTAKVCLVVIDESWPLTRVIDYVKRRTAESTPAARGPTPLY
ncbi:ParB/RepB/Spo0J family partition protein, partial [Corallococcus terminator]